MDKYNQIVVADEETVEHEFKYDNPYRGKVQNHHTEGDYQPLYLLSYMPYSNVVNPYTVFVASLDEFNAKLPDKQHLFLSCNPASASQEQNQALMKNVELLSRGIDAARENHTLCQLLLRRAVNHTALQDLDAAANDLTTAIEVDSAFSLAYWQRGVCLSLQAPLMGADAPMMMVRALTDIEKAMALEPENAYLVYDRACIYIQQQQYEKAVADYTTALKLQPALPEALFNRGLALIHLGKTQEGIADLSRAGELGIYGAYSVIKKYR